MTTNLRGSDDQSEERIEKYTNAIAFEEPSYNLRGNGSIETYESQLITISNDDKLPDNFNLQQYLMERSWKNIIGKHLNMAIIMENEAIIE
jgi:hypothetical protein